MHWVNRSTSDPATLPQGRVSPGAAGRVKPLRVLRMWNRRNYGATWEYQRRLHARRRNGEIPDTLLLLEHDPVVTVGRTGRASNLVVSEEVLAQRGIELIWSDRGGDVTYHGPGQLIGYLIVDLKGLHHDVHRFVRDIEEGIIRTVADWEIPAERIDGKTGVWVSGSKLASIGLKASHWVMMHGFALNVSTDLSAFDLIIPCGIPDCRMTSIEKLTGEKVGLDTVGRSIARVLSHIWNWEPEFEETDGWPI